MTISCSDCFSDLICREDSDVVFTGGGEDLPECSTSEYESLPPAADLDESIASLIENEQNFVPGIDYVERFQSQPLDAAAREDSIAWILKVSFYKDLEACSYFGGTGIGDKLNRIAYLKLPVFQVSAINRITIG